MNLTNNSNFRMRLDCCHWIEANDPIYLIPKNLKTIFDTEIDNDVERVCQKCYNYLCKKTAEKIAETPTLELFEENN